MDMSLLLGKSGSEEISRGCVRRKDEASTSVVEWLGSKDLGAW